MKKKGLLIMLIITGVILFECIGANEVFAAINSESWKNEGHVDDRDIHARSYIYSTTADSSTYSDVYDTSVYCKVDATYGAVNLQNYDVYTDHKIRDGYSSATAPFSCPSGYQSVSVSADHYASKNGSTWSGPTYKSYP